MHLFIDSSNSHCPLSSSAPTLCWQSHPVLVESCDCSLSANNCCLATGCRRIFFDYSTLAATAPTVTRRSSMSEIQTVDWTGCPSVRADRDWHSSQLDRGFRRESDRHVLRTASNGSIGRRCRWLEMGVTIAQCSWTRHQRSSMNCSTDPETTQARWVRKAQLETAGVLAISSTCESFTASSPSSSFMHDFKSLKRCLCVYIKKIEFRKRNDKNSRF